MTEGMVFLVLGITVLAFVLKNAILHMVCVPMWIFLGFFMWNQTSWPEGNTFLQPAFFLVCVAMAIVNLIVALNHYLGQRTEPPTHDDVQRNYKRKILDITGRRGSGDDPWFR